ncbi:MAG: sigma-70 family RNA polymerase sigma factor [Phycisphaerae bacterium]|nr:sigma-70 family RNA polymerase sigma factor [Phycisphaerae bacterium]
MIFQTTHVSLLKRLTGGVNADPGAWDEFCGRYGELILGYARRRGLQPADCDDVVQDVLLSLAKAMPSFQYDPAKGKFRAYLHTMVAHAVQRKWFQNRGERTLDSAAASALSDGCDADEHWEAAWRQHHLRMAMGTIQAEFNAADCAAFRAYAVECRGARETADELGLTLEQVYQAKSRILRRLSALIEQQVLEEG